MEGRLVSFGSYEQLSWADVRKYTSHGSSMSYFAYLYVRNLHD